MLLSPNKISLDYVYRAGDLTETWYYGDYLRKVATYFKDSEEKDKLESEITDVQNTEWPTVESYDKAINRCARRIENYIGTHEDPFIIK
jgi:hypothetical protein